MCLRIAGLLACAGLFAQNADVPALRITVNLVQIDAVVTDQHGHHVADLTKDDFRILQDGKSQAITHFSYVRGAVPSAPAPPQLAAPTFTQPRREEIQRSVVLMVDDLGLSFTSMSNVRDTLGSLWTPRFSRATRWR
jgi:VWFA-related protein